MLASSKAASFLGLLLALAASVPLPAQGGEVVTLFVTSEKTDTVNVYRGPVPVLALVRSIKVGRSCRVRTASRYSPDPSPF